MRRDARPGIRRRGRGAATEGATSPPNFPLIPGVAFVMKHARRRGAASSRAAWPFVLATLIPLAITTDGPGLVRWVPRLFAR